MTEYKLTNKAVEDLSRIWDYTFEVWSEKQADNYYEGLISYIKNRLLKLNKLRNTLKPEFD